MVDYVAIWYKWVIIGDTLYVILVDRFNQW